MNSIKKISIGADTYNIQDVGLRDLLNGKSTFAGIATPDLNPGTPNSSIFYIANESGSYSNFITENSQLIYIEEGESAILEWNPEKSNVWIKHTISQSGVIDLGSNSEANNYLADPGNFMTQVEANGSAVIFNKPMLYTFYNGTTSTLVICIAGSGIIHQIAFGLTKQLDGLKHRIIQWSMKASTIGGKTKYTPTATNISEWLDYSVTSTTAGLMTPDLYNTLNSISETLGGNAQVIEWDNSSNINTYTAAGVYRLKGTRFNLSDGLPISNIGSGNTIDALLQVFDPSLENGSGKDTDICVTQILTLSNRVGGDGDIFIRTGRGVNKYSINWDSWSKLQTNTEVGQVTSLDTYIDNGIYSGVLVSGLSGSGNDTFVMVVINNYAVAKTLGKTRTVSQYLYSNDADGLAKFNVRVGKGDTDITWGDWRTGLTNSIYYSNADGSRTTTLGVTQNGSTLILGSDSSLIGMLETTPGENPITTGKIVTFKSPLNNNKVTLANTYKSNEGAKISIVGEYGTSSQATYDLIGNGSFNIINGSQLCIGTSPSPGITSYVKMGTGTNIGASVNIGVGVEIAENLSLSTAMNSMGSLVVQLSYNGKKGEIVLK